MLIAFSDSMAGESHLYGDLLAVAGAISVAVQLDGTTLPASTMIVTPAAVDEYFNVSRAINVSVWRGCCESIAVRNTSDQPIQVQNANIIFSRPDLAVTY